MTTHRPHRQRAVKAIVGAFTRRLHRLAADASGIEQAIAAAGRATRLAFREKRISVDDAFLRVPEGLGFALTQQLRAKEGISSLEVLRLIRLGRELCGVDAEVFTGELMQQQAA